MAKTQYSFSDDPTKLGAPEGFRITVRNLKVSAGAGFIVALTGDIMTMPGLPKVPAAEKIDVDARRQDRRPVLTAFVTKVTCRLSGFEEGAPWTRGIRS